MMGNNNYSDDLKRDLVLQIAEWAYHPGFTKKIPHRICATELVRYNLLPDITLA